MNLDDAIEILDDVLADEEIDDELAASLGPIRALLIQLSDAVAALTGCR